jgi:hypothetical protein
MQPQNHCCCVFGCTIQNSLEESKGYQTRNTRQAALERQDLSCTYLAHHELESVLIVIIIIRPETPGDSKNTFLHWGDVLGAYISCGCIIQEKFYAVAH